MLNFLIFILCLPGSLQLMPRGASWFIFHLLPRDRLRRFWTVVLTTCVAPSVAVMGWWSLLVWSLWVLSRVLRERIPRLLVGVTAAADRAAVHSLVAVWGWEDLVSCQAVSHHVSVAAATALGPSPARQRGEGRGSTAAPIFGTEPSDIGSWEEEGGWGSYLRRV